MAVKLTFSSSFDGDGLKKKAHAVAEKNFKERAQKALLGLNGVTVSFSGSMARGDLKANVSGADASQVEEAKKRLRAM